MKTKTNFPFQFQEIPHVWIPMSDGVRLSARMWLPNIEGKVPAILEYLPYRKRDGTIVRDALTHPYFAGHGYAAVRVDMRGNGDSEGIMLDEYTQQELQDAEAVIQWLCEQAWCSGKVGMMGISWGGFNSLQVAARRPQGLAAIITLCSTDDRYSDDIHYKGGCVLGENLGWSSTMLAYSSRPPDPLLVGEAWRPMWIERLIHEPLLAIEWLKHPHRDAYWKHGSVCEDFSQINIPVLAIGGWHDAYHNAVPRLVAHIKTAQGIIGPWAHKYPHFAVPKPQIGFLQEALAWWDQWLQPQPQQPQSIPDTHQLHPQYRVYVIEAAKANARLQHCEGSWVSFNSWPQAEQGMEFYLNANHRLETAPTDNEHLPLSTLQHVGADAGEYCVIWLGAEFAGDQRRDDAFSLCFETEALTEDTVLVGAPLLKLVFRSDQPTANIAARLCAVFPDGASTRLSYTVFNLCHRDSHETPSALEPHRHYSAQIKLDDMAYRVKAGTRLRLSLSTSYWPMIWPSAYNTKLEISTAASQLFLPCLNDYQTSVKFDCAEAAPALERQILSPNTNERKLSIDQGSGKVELDIVDDFGQSYYPHINLTIASCAREHYEIMPDDPLSAVQTTHWTETLEREAWKIRTETFSRQVATITHWHVTGKLLAYENDVCIYEKSWDETIPRALN